ncbi:MAG: antibiotic biosynthesis monooxygenase [Ruminococcaceae bacterium]|nr:antibiotic biosynthesis monooxygenase [Oscillospiraceae bacterium]
MYYYYVVQTAKEGCREKFVEELNAAGVSEAIRAEDGCIKYDFYYSENHPNEILLVEIWESREHQQVHLTQPHMDTLRAIKAKYIIDTKLGEEYPQ